MYVKDLERVWIYIQNCVGTLFLVTCSWKPTKCMLEALVRRC